jgi:LysM repeat protein
MVLVSRYVVLTLLLVVGGLLVACNGGGGDGDSQAPGNISLTDPNTVPSSTPISTAQVFLIRENGVSAPTGATATISSGGNGGGGGGNTYTVQSGDTCGLIASSLEVATADLIAANPLINAECTNLQPGQLLAVPGGSGGGGSAGVSTPTPGAASGDTHVIASGDTCFDIAAAYGVDLDALIALNNVDCGALQPGQIIQIP